MIHSLALRARITSHSPKLTKASARECRRRQAQAYDNRARMTPDRSEFEFLESFQRGAVLVIRLVEHSEFRKQIDHGDIYRGLTKLIEDTESEKIILDFAGLEQLHGVRLISTPMNNVYVRAKRCGDRYGSEWRLCGLVDSYREFFELSYLNSYFPNIHDTLAEAMEAFGSSEA